MEPFRLLALSEDLTVNATEQLTDILPLRLCGRMTVKFFPGILPGCGVVRIEGKRDGTTYAVVEFPTEWQGRAFRFEKVAGEGTDKSEESYSCFIANDERQHKCECRGFARWHHCKHTDTAATLISNRWL